MNEPDPAFGFTVYCRNYAGHAEGRARVARRKGGAAPPRLDKYHAATRAAAEALAAELRQAAGGSPDVVVSIQPVPPPRAKPTKGKKSPKRDPQQMRLF